MVHATVLAEASSAVTKLGEVAMKAVGPVGILAALQAGGAEREGGAKAAKRKNRKKTGREEVEPSWGVIAEPLSNGTPVCG